MVTIVRSHLLQTQGYLSTILSGLYIMDDNFLDGKWLFVDAARVEKTFSNLGNIVASIFFIYCYFFFFFSSPTSNQSFIKSKYEHCRVHLDIRLFNET